MAVRVSVIKMAVSIALFGLKSFVYGILAETKKPGSGNISISNGIVTCKYPPDPSVIWGPFSIVALTVSATLGFYSVFFPYKGKSVPYKALFHTTKMFIFFLIAVLVTLLATAMLLWATLTEVIHLTNNVHHNMNTKCSTAKTGLFGGAAFMALNASLFWLVSLMLANNAREDYLNEDSDENRKGEYDQVDVVDHEAMEQANA